MLAAIRDRHLWLPDLHNPYGVYLDNGSRYYLDSGNHNEFSSPEVRTPRQIAVCDRAAEQILLRARDDVKADGIDLCITKNNINFARPDQASWGQHEAYTCWIPLDAAAEQLIPHMASRVGYAGAGCLSSHAAGMGFELSQRARHMTRAMGAETTHNRAIFCTRAWKSSDVSDSGWTRTNIISKDSQRCSYGMYLTHGVTSLLFMIINNGHRIGANVRLSDPVAAMRAFSLDPWHQTAVARADGKHVTAIDIQREYLRQATPHVESGDYPEWTSELLSHWKVTLDQLEHDPMQLANRLDAYIKLSIFDHHVARAGVTWAELRQALKALDRMRRAAPEPVVAGVLKETAEGLDREQLQLYRRLCGGRRLQRIGLDRLRFAVRLQSLELKYHELGGLFDQFHASGLVDPVVVSEAEVERAIHHPPDGGRAEARSKTIRQFHGHQWACDWEQAVSQTDGRWVDLRDPFSNRREVTLLDERPSHGRHDSELLRRLRARVSE
jgi:hypothetical protein